MLVINNKCFLWHQNNLHDISPVHEFRPFPEPRILSHQIFHLNHNSIYTITIVKSTAIGFVSNNNGSLMIK